MERAGPHKVHRLWGEPLMAYRPVVPREQACAQFRALYAAWLDEAAYQSAEQIADAALIPGGPSRDELIARVHELRAYRKTNAA